MSSKILLIFLSFFTFFLFTSFSYTVAKEAWQEIDFDATVKLQDHISRKYDGVFSYFTFLGSVEVTIGATLVLALASLLRKKLIAFIGWLLIFPASFFEIFGKLVVFHPAPPVLFHRNILETALPSFYVHTNFSYPSGHMTRTIFLVAVFSVLVLASRKKSGYKLVVLFSLFTLGFLMALTRVYLGEHWLSDVLGGIFLGLSTGFFSAGLIIGKSAVKMR